MLFDERPSDSALVEKIWYTQSDTETPFLSVAASNWEMVVTRWNGTLSLSIRGPETTVSSAICPPDAEFFGIVFKLGTYMPRFPALSLLNGGVVLPDVSRGRVCLDSTLWELPTYENADTFVERLTRTRLLCADPLVGDVWQGERQELSTRTVQRRFLGITGLTYGMAYQIERARKAAMLLREGVTIPDTVTLAGYADQPHLTRSMKRYIGYSPAQIRRESALPMSFLFTSETIG